MLSVRLIRFNRGSCTSCCPCGSENCTLIALALRLEARARVLVAGALASAVNKPLAANLRGSLREGPNSDGLWELTPPIQHRLQPHETNMRLGVADGEKLDVAARVERLQHAALGRQAVLDLAKFVSRACFAKSDAVTRASCAKTHRGPILQNETTHFAN